MPSWPWGGEEGGGGVKDLYRSRPQTVHEKRNPPQFAGIIALQVHDSARAKLSTGCWVQAQRFGIQHANHLRLQKHIKISILRALIGYICTVSMDIFQLLMSAYKILHSLHCNVTQIGVKAWAPKKVFFKSALIKDNNRLDKRRRWLLGERGRAPWGESSGAWTSASALPWPKLGPSLRWTFRRHTPWTNLQIFKFEIQYKTFQFQTRITDFCAFAHADVQCTVYFPLKEQHSKCLSNDISESRVLQQIKISQSAAWNLSTTSESLSTIYVAWLLGPQSSSCTERNRYDILGSRELRILQAIPCCLKLPSSCSLRKEAHSRMRKACTICWLSRNAKATCLLGLLFRGW